MLSVSVYSCRATGIRSYDGIRDENSEQLVSPQRRYYAVFM